MAVKAPSNIKNPVATTRGWCNEKGELLKSQKLTQAECDEFNGVAKAVPAAVEEVVEEAVVVEEKTKRKARSKAKKSSSIIASALKKIKGE